MTWRTRLARRWALFRGGDPDWRPTGYAYRFTKHDMQKASDSARRRDRADKLRAVSAQVAAGTLTPRPLVLVSKEQQR